MRFVDTNVLLYAISTDPNEASKRSVANALLDEGDIALSAQVLQEFYVQATRSTRSAPIPHERAANLVRSFARFPIKPTNVQLVMAAIGTRERFRISYWDAAIIEAARALGCAEVLSEDLGAGQDYAGVVVKNPFAFV